jgi:hypothetical protein
MKLRMTESSEKYGVPVGRYWAKFLGARADTHPEYGEGLKWEFEITEGSWVGKVVSRTTSPVPTAKNACGKMLQMLTGCVAAPNQEFDLDLYVGRVFQVMVEANSTGNGTRVGSVMPLAGAATPPPQQPATAAPSSGRPAPPPRGSAPPVGEAAAKAARLAARFWVDLPSAPAGSAPQEMTGQQLQIHVNAATSQADLDAIAVMNYEQSSGWKTPGNFGFAPDVPY